MEMLLNNIPKPTKEDEQICIATTHINLNKKFIKLYIIKYKGFEKKKKQIVGSIGYYYFGEEVDCQLNFLLNSSLSSH